MGKGIFIIGTNTGIGKTFITGGIVYKLKKEGYSVIPYKPIQSGGIKSEDLLISQDIKYIKEICDLDENCEKMNTYCLYNEVSPHLADKIENINILKENIINHYKKLTNEYDYVVVEGAGGVVVPLIDNDYYIYDLIKDLDLDVVMLSSPYIGTINHTVLAYEFLKNKDINCKGIFINRYTGNFYEDDNISVIKNITKLDILGVIHKLDDFKNKNIKKEYDNFDTSNLMSLFK
ncbi:dethiobiotin synthase [Romboutsia sp. 1001713B170207_170306_H8]|uniref:dethiobiotin synthase n=1 Tax=Romboutsia sp. 1001713B170207_170306_H8 TaxID=2787112 RepID=UPI00189AF431|nr:dethiobiotin synthase [Romboutsia sp. 1001713B170207_170306_H8]